MAGHRPERLSERIHQEVSIMLQRDISDPRLAGVNITRVEVTGDLRLAKVYVSARSGDPEDKEKMAALSRAAGYFRRQLAGSLELHFAPEIRFYPDYSVEKGERFLGILNQVQAESKPPRRTKSNK